MNWLTISRRTGTWRRPWWFWRTLSMGLLDTIREGRVLRRIKRERSG